MAEYEREVRTTTTDGDPAYVRTRTTDDDRVTYVRRGGSATPWLIAAIVAVFAIIAIAFLMTDRNEPTTDDLAAAVDAGRAAGFAEGAATAVDNLPTTVPVPVPVPMDNGAAERSAADAAAAAADARAAAQSAADAAADALDPDTSVSSNTTTP